MGTNFYEVGQSGLRHRHVGKSSGGWTFALRVYPDEGVNTLEDWIAIFKHPATRLVDEYGREVDPQDLLLNITERSWDWGGPVMSNRWIRQKFLEDNCCVEGPNGLVRCPIDGVHCIGHGAGTWDYIAGEFS